jgi:trafficking protein particle complex subunit 1
MVSLSPSPIQAPWESFARELIIPPAECIYQKKWIPATLKANQPSADAPGRKALSAEDDAKLIFGTIFSLRNMVRKLGGPEDKYVARPRSLHILRQLAGEGLEMPERCGARVYTCRGRVCMANAAAGGCSFVSYRTGHYKLHYYETPTNVKFVMITDTKTSNLRIVLHQIYVGLYVEYGTLARIRAARIPG